ncbi:MAG: hypothetical protein Q9190_007697, partial [Brigantiaea leucoxantha]
MPTQYDSIGTLYNGMKTLPVASLERRNVEAAIKPHIQGARVLDLACGTGYYSRFLLEWGARQVVGVDISSTMVDAACAAATSAAEPKDRLDFLVGDCATPEPIKHDGGDFDIVLGAWFLNYAPDAQTLKNMFRTVSLNLKAGGRFIGIVWPPTSNPRRHLQKALIARPAGRNGGIEVLPTKRLRDGGVVAHL